MVIFLDVIIVILPDDSKKRKVEDNTLLKRLKMKDVSPTKILIAISEVAKNKYVADNETIFDMHLIGFSLILLRIVY